MRNQILIISLSGFTSELIAPTVIKSMVTMMRDYVAHAGRSCFVISRPGRLASQSAENYQRLLATDRNANCVAEACPIENTLTPTNHTARTGTC